ncbi:MAG: ubiquinone/menaquinone biosynthesis methyltransferase [Candidatus Zixiibacteriota bacterium]
MQRKKAFIHKMFSEIAPIYDRMNRLISLGFDNRWRRRAVKPLAKAHRVLDLCAGSGDMSIALLKQNAFAGEVVLCDFNRDMLHLAKRKCSVEDGGGFADRTVLVVADAELLPFKEGSFDGVTIGFALRNLPSLEKLSGEIIRAMKNGGLATFLEVAHPENKILEVLFHLYFYKLVPAISKYLTTQKYAYRYLPASLRVFFKQRELVELFRKAGFPSVSYSNIWGGIGAIYFLRK